MEIVRRLTDLEPGAPIVATIGNFDGVHRGHQHLIALAQQRAAARGARAAVITFDPHPLLVLRPDQPFTQLVCFSDKVKLLGRLGVDLLVVVTFTPHVASQTAEEFMATLRRRLNLVLLVEGDDFALGRGRAGTMPVLAEIGTRLGYQVEPIPRITDDGEEISSAAIRRHLAAGEVDQAGLLLGRASVASGPVVEGARRGRTIGFPTANLAVPEGLALPANGVYAAVATSPELSQPERAMVNIGTRPTFDHGARTVEAHLLDYDGDLYGMLLTLHFVSWLRTEQRFDGVAGLVAQLERDRVATEAALSAEVVAAAVRPLARR
ncbi:MAG: bifunctional riboflavin kinase/FAD synthetase [Chloroflexi bacterium]|nr:bifunctional riboflavin kinase/FAD synthetase [Chloroflexota bacterium]